MILSYTQTVQPQGLRRQYTYPLAHSARAELCRRLGRTSDARASYERALALTRQGPERRFLERRLQEV